MNRDYLKALTDLLRKKGNLLLAHDLRQAFDESWAQRVEEFFSEIEHELNSYLQKLPGTQSGFISTGGIREVALGRRGATFELRLDLKGSTTFGAALETGRLWFYVACNQEDCYGTFQNILQALPNNGQYPGVPWWAWSTEMSMDVRHPSRGDIGMLMDRNKRQELVAKVSTEVKGILSIIVDAKLLE